MEDNKRALVPVLEAAIARALAQPEIRKGTRISVRLCKTRYPQGGEKLLILALTGREVPSGGLPADCGCIVQNVGTLAAQADAFDLGMPLIERGLTVSGGACGHPRNIIAPIGTQITDLPPDSLNINEEKLVKVLYGGPMMGVSVPHAEVPIQKNTSGILLLTRKETYVMKETPCVRCGKCVSFCSARLHPVLMNNALDRGGQNGLDEAASLGLMDCMECGACAYVCPARIKLTQRFRVGKVRYRALLAQRRAMVTPPSPPPPQGGRSNPSQGDAK
jgi:electron transport complex protein RnfC